MSTQDSDLLLCLESSLRNALATFGPASPQYISIKYMVDEQAAKIALQRMRLDASKQGTRGDVGSGRVMELVFRPKGV